MINEMITSQGIDAVTISVKIGGGNLDDLSVPA
jgi:hypothetical protein